MTGNVNDMINLGFISIFFQYQTPRFSKDGSYFITKWPFSQPGGVGKFIHLAKIGTKVCFAIKRAK